MVDAISTEIDKAITHAVNARIEAEVAKALSGDEVIGQYVAAALQQQVEVRRNGGYRTEKVPFLHEVLRQAIQEATKEAVRNMIAEELPTLENEVRKALRRQVTGIAESLANSLTKAASTAYGVNVEMSLKIPRAGD